LLVQELFERGEPSFVDELRKIDDAETLGAFASRWMADTRPEARQFLFDYLDRPLNAYRHEALVKRLFKQAEAAADDALMARFLVCFDRAVRRLQSRRIYFEWRQVESQEAASTLAAAWRNRGFAFVDVRQARANLYHVSGQRIEPILRTPSRTTMPRGTMKQIYDLTSLDRKTWRYKKTLSVPDWVFALKLDPVSHQGEQRLPEAHRPGLEHRRLFSIATRNYLRRRAWRYLRTLGRACPERYVAGAREALIQYRDADVADGLALIDSWGLIHILFHFSPCLVADDRGWRVAEGHSLAELEPAPAYARLWESAPRALAGLLTEARCRPVRGWAIRMIRRNMAAVAPLISLEERLGLLGSDDPDLAGLAAEMLRDDPALTGIAPERWLTLVETASPAALEILCELMERLIAPDRISLAQAARLAVARPLPAAALGLRWLQAKTPRDADECRTVLGLVEAEAEPLRIEIVRWARGVLGTSDLFRPDWVLQWLDSRHADVRGEGWQWFRAEPRAHDDIVLWQRLMETPYDDVRLALVADLEARTEGALSSRVERGDLDPELLRLLWASVLLNVHRGHRAKPLIVRRLLRRITTRPAELPRLLPLLAVALRSVRGPEWRAGLAAVVRLAERDEIAAGLIRQAFPELQLAGSPAEGEANR
jgi:hypothetical protein